MPINISTNKIKIKDGNEYISFDVLSDETTAERIADINAAGQDVLDSIPSDYTELSDDVDQLKDDLTDIQTATSDDIGKALSPKTVSGGKVTEWQYKSISGGGGGTSDYTDLDNKPKINSTTLNGNQTASDLGLAPATKTNYITPEMYGAVGDGTTDDTTAIQNCINAAISAKQPVRGFNIYKTTSTITISTTYLDLEINRLSYTGESYALSISGGYNNLRFAQIYCSNGKGINMTRTESGYCSWNKISVMRLYAKGHAVEYTTDYGIYYNTFDIRYIKSDTGNCYCGTGKNTENVYMNSSCACQAGWAIYNCGGRFYNFTLEGDVLNGIYVDNTNMFCSGFRIRELVDKLVRRIAGLDQSTGGTLVKFVGGQPVCGFKFISEDAVPYEAIDVSEMWTLDYIETHDVGSKIEQIEKLSFPCVIEAPIRYGQWETTNGYCNPGKRMLVTGGQKICIPSFETLYEITSATYDMRDSQVALNNAKPYPTKMVIGVDNCVIYLPTSYCPYGYSEFIVDQTNHLCTIYDSRNSVTPIFNGANFGAGVYKFHAYCDTADNAIHDVDSRYSTCLNDTENYVWEITRIDAVTGTNDVGIVNVDDFGAVGDGTTDDSQAVQDAVDAGYDVYFSSNKTYYLASTVEIDHDVYLHGGENAVIKTKTPSGGTVNDGIVISGTLKKTTTLTTDYSSNGDTANCNNKFTLSDMTDITIGDIMVIVATDQYYSYARQYYYLGATLLITDIYDGHIYTSDSMPWSITNTANVSVKIYSAPTAIVDNLHFVSDLDTRAYKYLLKLERCKNSVVKNCSFMQMDNGLRLHECVNTLVDGISLAKSKYDNNLNGDGYGLAIYSCTNTIIERVMATCAQHAIAVTGEEPSINTYVRNCDLSAECRSPGLDTHECSYNLVVEDCVLATASIHGTVWINRCQVIKNKRQTSAYQYIDIHGSHNPEWSKYRITNTVFEDTGIYIANPSPQTPIQAFNDIVGNVEVENCSGGALVIGATTSTTILSNTINSLSIKNWKDCYEIYIPSGNVTIIKNLIISDSTFGNKYFVTDHNSAHGVVLGNIEYLDFKNIAPLTHKVSVYRDTYGEHLLLPKNTSIGLSSNNASAQFIVCGKNLVSDNRNDYVVGTVSGTTGNALSRTAAGSSQQGWLTVNSSGNLVYTIPSNSSSKYDVYPVGMFLLKEPATVAFSAKLKNSGETSATSWKPYFAVVDASTGLVNTRIAGSAVEATASGASISYSRGIDFPALVLCYFGCSTAVSGSETTFEDFAISITPYFGSVITDSDEPYSAKRLTGDGTITSLEGINNIMSSESTFHVALTADYVDGVTTLPAGEGVSF